MYTNDSKDENGDDTRNIITFEGYTEKILNEFKIINNSKVDEKKENLNEHPMKVVFDLINNSINDDNLSKMIIPWNPWF